MMRGRIGAYAAVQLRDFAAGRGLLVLLAMSVLAGVELYRVRAGAGADWATGVEGRARALRLFDDLLAAFALLGAVAGIQGISSRDRRRGYYRLLFARSVSPVRYYAQAFIVRGLALVGAAAVGAQIFSLFVRPVPVGGAVAYAAMAWMAVGGLGFLLSALTVRDGSALVTLLLAAFLLNGPVAALRFAGEGTPLAAALPYLLPPAHLLASVRAMLTRGAPLDPPHLAWTLGFGAICFAGGLVVLRRRPLAA